MGFALGPGEFRTSLRIWESTPESSGHWRSPTLNQQVCDDDQEPART